MANITPSYYLSFGMVTIPVKSYVAARDQRTYLTNLHDKCKAKLNQSRKCSACGEEINKDNLVKGYEVDGGYVLMSEDELSELHAEKSKTMEIMSFVPWKEIDPIFLGTTNYLGPADQASVKGFELLKAAMVKTGRVAIAQYVQAGHDKVGIIRPAGDCLILHEAFYANEVRSYDSQKRLDPKPVEINKDEMTLAVDLVEAMADKFDIDEYEDGYQARLNSLIEAKLQGKVVEKPAAKKAAGDVLDLLSALKSSVESGRKAKAKAAGKKKVAKEVA